MAKFDSSDESVAYVTSNGQAVGVDRGEVAVIVRFRVFIRAPRLTFVRDIKGFRWPDVAAANYVDEHVHAKRSEILHPDHAGRARGHEARERERRHALPVPDEAEVLRRSAAGERAREDQSPETAPPPARSHRAGT